MVVFPAPLDPTIAVVEFAGMERVKLFRTLRFGREG